MTDIFYCPECKNSSMMKLSISEHYQCTCGHRVSSEEVLKNPHLLRYAKSKDMDEWYL